MQGLDTLYQYDDPLQFIVDQFEACKRRNPKYSLRAFSAHLGFNSPSTLSSILVGKRRLTPNIARRIMIKSKATSKQVRFLELLAKLRYVNDGEEKSAILDEIKAIRPGFAYRDVEHDAFRTTADWYHLAILAMFDLKNFGGEVKDIQNRLEGAPQPAVIASTIERLERMGFLVRNDAHELKPSDEFIFLGDKGLNEAIQKYHLEMIDKGRAALIETDMAVRSFRGSCFALAEKDFTKAVALTKKYHEDMLGLSVAGQGDHVYQLNTQLFRLTKKNTMERSTP